MDTEEDTPRPNELQDGTMAKVNALREQASQPTQAEQNTANIDYLLMTVGGDQ